MNQIATAGNRGMRVRSDCHVTLEIKESGGIALQLNSKVERMYGNQIRQLVFEVLEALNVQHASSNWRIPERYLLSLGRALNPP